MVPYRRVLLKLSGETLMAPRSFGVSAEGCSTVAATVRELHELGIEVAIVVGGGNFFRGVQASQLDLNRISADTIGMLATLMNGVALQQSLLTHGVKARLMSDFECPKAAESYIWHRAVNYLQEGEVVVLVGGTGHPYFTTDTAAALRASEIQAELLMKATKVDGVFDKDPVKHPEAKKYGTITYSQVLAEKLAVMDATAIALCRENRIPILVFNFSTCSLVEALQDPQRGSLVSGD